MARIRTVKPDFFRHELLQDLELTYQGKYPMLVFEGLWGHCDKAGRFEWRPRHLKLDILPFLPFDMAETLELLAKSGMVKKYTVDGKEYGEIPSFTEHQRIGGKEAQEPEKHPKPASEEAVNIQGSNGEATGKHSGSSRDCRKGREGNGYVGLAPDDVRIKAASVLAFLNETAGRDYRPVEANIGLIAARLKEGATVEDCKAVVSRKVAEWSGGDMAQYLRPATLFNATKFAQYQGESSRPHRNESVERI